MAAPSEKEDLITQFVNITGVDNERAKFYLESSAWQVDVAISSFYEDDANEMPEEVPPVETEKDPASAPVKKKSTNPSNITTLSQMEESGNSSEDEGQAFYAGGSERSGQQVLGPGKKKDKNRKLVSDMFKAAKEHGAEVVDPSESAKPKKGTAFTGSGFKLTGDAQSGAHTSISAPEREPRQVTLRLWSNGFSVDDGPLRDFMDPQNKDFLSSIQRGEIPLELTREARGMEVHLNMEDHREEDYKPPKVTLKPFTGKGHVLGSPAPSVISVPTTPPSNSSASGPSITVDKSKPTTNIQIRLPDGSRLVHSFNHSHTVGDLRRYVIAERPQYGAQLFSLMTNFPNRELDDNSLTLESANLLNAAVMLRLN